MPKNDTCLTGGNTKVRDGEKYRILVYDRKDADYRFIKKSQRIEPFYTSLFGKDMVMSRFECRKAYVFDKDVECEDFSYENMQEASEWAEQNCLEARTLPKWFYPEIADMNFSHCRTHPFNFGEIDPDDYVYIAKKPINNLRDRNQELEYHI